MNKVWKNCWDRLWMEIREGKTSWGKNELLSFISGIEREELIKSIQEKENELVQKSQR